MKTNKFLYGLLAIAPLFFVITMFGFMFMMFSEIFSHPHAYSNGDPSMIPYATAMQITGMVAGVVALIGTVTYIVHCLNNVHIEPDKRTTWIIVLALLGMIGMWIYYYNWIRKEDELNAENPIKF